MMLHTNLTAQAIDDVLIGTFPASDPPAWTPGVVRPAPAVDDQGTPADRPQSGAADRRGVIDVSRRTHDTPAQKLTALVGAAGLSLTVPFVVLAIGLPVALGVRGLLELAEWLVALVR
jgi:hypothetical protein